MKTCKKCCAEKEFVDFYRDARTKDGREGVCKECRIRAKINRITHNRKMTISKKRNNEKDAYDPREVKINMEEILLFDQLRRRHNTYISVSYHPHLDGYAVKLNAPRFHAEGKDLASILRKAISLPPIEDKSY